MNLELLKVKLEKENALDGRYSIGKIEDSKHCLVNDHDEWLVFYYKNKVKHNTAIFSNEEDACVYFYRHLLLSKRYVPEGKPDVFIRMEIWEE